MLDKKKWLQYGTPRKQTIKGITIHNTGNSLTAEELENIMATTSQHFATHYFIDDKEIRQVMPLEYAVWHTGKGYDLGNMRTISIEICKSTSDIETYMKAQTRAIELVKELMNKYNLSKDYIFFHSDFDNTYCPHRILEIYKNKKLFIEKEIDI